MKIEKKLATGRQNTACYRVTYKSSGNWDYV